MAPGHTHLMLHHTCILENTCASNWWHSLWSSNAGGGGVRPYRPPMIARRIAMSSALPGDAYSFSTFTSTPASPRNSCCSEPAVPRGRPGSCNSAHTTTRHDCGSHVNGATHILGHIKESGTTQTLPHSPCTWPMSWALYASQCCRQTRQCQCHPSRSLQGGRRACCFVVHGEQHASACRVTDNELEQ